MLYEPTPIGKICNKCNRWMPRQRLVKCKRCTYGVNGICLDCKSKDAKEKRAANPLKYRLHWKKYSQTHADQLRERDRRRSKEKQEYIKLIRRDTPTKIRAYHRAWRQINRDKVRKYERDFRAAHPTTIRLKRQRREAIKRELVADFTQEQWERCLDYWSHRCAYCGRPRGLWHTLAQDHFVPESKRGDYTATNIVPACHGTDGCNNRKRDKSAIEFLVDHFGETQAIGILERILAYFQSIT